MSNTIVSNFNPTAHIEGLVQQRENPIANALESRLSCTNPSICLCNCSFDHCRACFVNVNGLVFRIIRVSERKSLWRPRHVTGSARSDDRCSGRIIYLVHPLVSNGGKPHTNQHRLCETRLKHSGTPEHKEYIVNSLIPIPLSLQHTHTRLAILSLYKI